MQRFVWICVGGAAGTGMRYLLSLWAARALGDGFPYGTLAVNVLGSLLLGVLMQLGLGSDWATPTLRLALTTGVMGGFTTFSTFSFETARYLQDGNWTVAILNVALTVVVCLGATFLGFALGRLIAG